MMGKLVKAEFLKLSKSLGYKILLLCAVGLSVLAGLLLADSEYGMADGYSAYLSALTDTQVFMTFAIIFAAVFVSNEFSNRTFGMSLFSGCPRRSVLLSKAIVFLIGLIPIVLAEPLGSGVIVSIIKGFGDLDTWTWAEIIRTTLLFILGSATMGGFCFMLAVVVKNIGGTIGAGLGIMLGMELLGMFPGTARVAKLTFLYQMKLLPQQESVSMFIAVTVMTLVVVLGASILIFQKTELK